MQSELPRRFYFLLLSVLLVGNISVYHVLLAPRVLTAVPLDVGKGSATLFHTPSGATILIDTGPDASILRALGKELPPWQRRIDVVLLTSGKSSAVGGLPDVLSHYQVTRQISLTHSQRLTFGTDTYIDIEIRKNAPAGVFVSDGGTVTKIKN
ncbi:MAG: hypothetical protein NT108_02045 [Candidatus Kaiserbacteria bacterium]|nr:hypothetical protein [Candidatus Kaiserbacteria bacterium]